MAKKTLNELSLGDKVSFKDVAYGSGRVLGYNKEIGKHLIGHTATQRRNSASFANKSGSFIQNKENKYVYATNTKGFDFYYWADSVLELLNTEEGKEYRVGDEVEVYCNSSAQPIAKTAAWEGAISRHATVIGFNEIGDPVLYFSTPTNGLAEYGLAWTSDFDRYTDARYDGSVDTTRRAFVLGSNLNMGKVNKTGKVKQVKVMESQKSSGEQSFFEMMKSDATTAAYRVATVQMTSATKKALVAMMEKKGAGSDRIQALKEMLDTQLGEAFISVILGYALNYAPVISNDPRAQKLGQEFRVSGFATAGNVVAEVALETIMPIITNALASLPNESATAVRVQTEKKSAITDLPTEEAVEEKTAAPKTMTA